jgi:hypothetical protein
MRKKSYNLSGATIILIFCFFVSALFSQQNIIINGDLERAEPFFWHPLNAGDGNSILSWTDEESYQDFRSLKIFKPNSSSDVVGWISENNAQRYWNSMTDNITYELGGYIKTSGVNTNPSSDEEVIGLLFKFFDAGNTLIAEILMPANQTGASVDWHQVTSSVVIPPGSVPDSMICIAQFGENATGTAWFDLITVQSNPWTAQMFGGEAETPLGWMYWTSPGSDELAMYDDSEAHSGTFSAKLRENDDETDEIVFYSIPVPVDEEHYYHISSWIKTEGINTDPQFTPTGVTTNRIDDRIGICFFFHLSPIETSWSLTAPGDLFFYIDQTVNSHDWRKYEAIWKAPAGAAGISMRARFNPLPTGTVWFDDFSVREVVNDSIIVIYPNGGENLIPEQDYDIAWTSTESITDVSIEYSTDSGTNWSIIVATTPNDGLYTWNVPITSSDNCLIRVTNIDGTPSDVSNTPFTILCGERHFTYNETEDYYPIIIENITLDDQPIEICDEIGVFARDDNNELICCGAIVWPNTGLLAWADDSQTADKDGFVPGEELVFRLWDASDQTEYGPPVTVNYTTGNGTWGDGPFAQISLMEFIGFCSITCFLEEGWNWICINVDPFEPAVVDIWDGKFCLEILKSYTGFYVPGIWDGIGDWDYKQMYTAYLACPESLYIEGECIDPSEPIILQEGWNWVCFLPDHPIPIETALASIVDYLNIVKAYDGFYVPGVWDGIGDMVPCEGYKIHVSQECTLIYPANDAVENLSRSERPTEVAGNICKHFTGYKTTEDYQAVLVQSINGKGIELSAGDELGVFTESGLCIGGVVLTDTYPIGLMAWMDDPRTEEVEGFMPGEQMVMKCWDASEEQEYELLITIEDGSELLGKSALTKVSLEVDLLYLESTAMPTIYSLHQNYPNPFNPETTIRYGIPEAGNVKLTIYSIDGQLVKELDHGFKEAGYHKVIWNGINDGGESISSGIYIYRMEAGKFSDVRKMVFLK